MEYKGEDRAFNRRNIEKKFGEAPLENRRGSEDLLTNFINSGGLDLGIMLAENKLGSQYSLLISKIRGEPQTVGNKYKAGRYAKAGGINPVYNQNMELLFSEDPRGKLARKITYLPSIAGDTTVVNERKKQSEEDPHFYGENIAPDYEDQLDQIGRAGSLQWRQQKATQASKLPLIGRQRMIYPSEISRKVREKEFEGGAGLATLNPNASKNNEPVSSANSDYYTVIEAESAACNNNLNVPSSPVAFKSAPVFIHAKHVAAKGSQYYGKVGEFKFSVMPAGVRRGKKMKRAEVNESYISNDNLDSSLMEFSPSKEEILRLSKSQNFESAIAIQIQRNNDETFDDNCVHPLAGSRNSLIKNCEDEMEEQNGPGKLLSMKKSRSSLSVNQPEISREKTIKNQKLTSSMQNRKALFAKLSPLKDGKLIDGTEDKDFKNGQSKNTGELQDQEIKNGDQTILELIVTPAMTHERSPDRRNIRRNAPRQRTNAISAISNNQSNSNIQPGMSSLTKEPDEKDPEKTMHSQKIGASKGPAALSTKNVYKTISNIAKTIEKQSNRMGLQTDKGTGENQKYYTYLDYLYKISFTFAVVSRPPTNQLTYKFFVGKGNNGLMVRTLLKTRWWWMPTDSSDAAEVNLIWTQLRNNKLIDSLKPKRKTLETNGAPSMNSGNALDNSGIATTNDTNSHDSATELTDSDGEVSSNLKASNDKIKSKLLRSKKALSKQKASDPFDSLSKIYTKAEYNDLHAFMKTTKKRILYAEDTEDLVKSSRKGQNMSVLDPIKVKVCNRMECNYHLSNKKALFYNMRAHYEALKENPFDYLPLTFHIKSGTEDKEYSKFLEYYNSRDKEVQEMEKQYQEADPAEKKALQSRRIKNIWIIKPGEHTNRGQGIRVASELSEIEQILNSGEKHVNGSHKTYIVQQYMDRPLLYNKRKFDIRCYMLITSINGYMKGYWYQDGYIRTCSKEFSMKNLSNKMVHLTNDAVQKKGEEYGKFENGNKVSFSDFQKYLDLTMPESKINFQSDIYPRMKNMARDSIRAVYGKIDPHRREHTFEVYGLDFMIDQNFKPWIIEVNTNPCLELSAPLLARIIPTMVENALRIAVDPLFPPPMPLPSKRNLIPENMLENNKFELIFDEVEDGPWLRSLSSSNTEAAMGQISEQEEEEDSENEDANENDQ